AAVRAIEFLLEAATLEPPDRFVRIGKDYDVSDASQKCRRGWSHSKKSLLNEIVRLTNFGFAPQMLVKNYNSFVQSPFLNMQEHVARRSGRDDEFSMPVFSNERDDFADRLIEIDRRRRVDLDMRMVRRH